MDDLSDMTLEKFKLWSIHALKVFLSKRNRPVSGTIDELSARAFCTWEQGIPVAKDGEEVEMRLLREYKSKLTINGEVIPDPFSLTSGWKGESKGMQVWPSIYITDIAAYIEGCGHSDIMNKLMGEYKVGKAYRYFECGWVREVFFHDIRPNSNICLLKSKVTPSQATNSACYNVWICVTKDHSDQPGGEIQSAYCTCTAGMYGTCNHIAGVLFRCEYAVKTGETKTTCTSQLSRWNVPRGKPSFKPVQARDVTWKKGHYTKGIAGKESDSDQLLKKAFTPYTKKQKDELEDVSRMRKNIHDIVSSEVPDACFCLVYEGRRLSKKTLELPSNIIESVKSSNSNEEAMKQIQLTEEQIKHVKLETSSQSESPAWHNQRKGRITASNFKRVCTRVETLQSDSKADAHKLVNTILGKDTLIQTKAMKHGLSLESFAKKEFTKEMKKTHKKFKSSSTGLQIFVDKPFLAASVDLETSCLCCGEGLCEIKCPESIKDQKPSCDNVKCIKEDNGQLVLKETHEYFYQVQGQMGITKRSYCDFFIYTFHGHLCIRVPFDEEFWKTMLNKLTWFWTEHVLTALLTPSTPDRRNDKTPLKESNVGNQITTTPDFNNNIQTQLSKQPVRRALLPNSEKKRKSKSGSAVLKRKQSSKRTPLYLCGECGDECMDNPEHVNDQSVCCDTCGTWVHYLCAGIKDEDVENMDEWFCLKCRL